MALPFQFAAVTNATGAQLDANNAALGALVVVPCTVSGTNTITMAPNANTPDIAAYAAYKMFSGVVAVSNSGAVTIQVGSLSALNAYKDAGAGPQPLTGGELIAGNAFTAMYDPALNGSLGGFHIYNNTSFAGGTITSNVVISGAALSVVGGSLGVTLTSALLSGNSLSISGVNASIAALNGSLGSVVKLMVGATASSITRFISALATVTLATTAANATQDATFALTGAQVNDSVALGLPASPPAGAGFTGFMAAAGTVTLRVINPTTVTLGAATITVRATAIGFT